MERASFLLPRLQGHLLLLVESLFCRGEPGIRTRETNKIIPYSVGVAAHLSIETIGPTDRQMNRTRGHRQPILFCQVDTPPCASAQRFVKTPHTYVA